MGTKKEGSTPFESFRIMGERAQKLLSRARMELRKKAPKEGAGGLPRPEHHEEIVIRLSIASLVQAAFAVLAMVFGTWLIIELQDKIILLLLAFFVSIIMDPGVRSMERMGIPRGFGILLHYVIALFIFLFLLFSLIPIIAAQLQQIAVFIGREVNLFLANPQVALPFLTESVNERLTELSQATLEDLSVDQFVQALQQLGQNLSSAAQGSLLLAAQLAGSVLAFFLQLIVVLVLAFFIQMEREKVGTWIRGLLPRRYQSYMDRKSEAIHIKIAQWARGQLLLALTIGLLVFIALEILGMPYAVTLAVLAGFTEFIPYVGPLIAAVPAVLIALTQEGFLWALIVAGVYYAIQWCENNLLVPLIMKRAVGLSPIAIIFAMMVGISFGNLIHPILGILLAVPTTTILALFIEDWRQLRQQE